MKKFQVKCQREGATGITTKYITASSASQAKEQVKSQYNGKVKIISCVEK